MWLFKNARDHLRPQFEQVGFVQSNHIYVQLKKSDYISSNKFRDIVNFITC